jgi:hypothetical protein
MIEIECSEAGLVKEWTDILMNLNAYTLNSEECCHSMTNDADQDGQRVRDHNLDNHLEENLPSYITVIRRDQNTIHENKLLHWYI